MIQPSPTTVAEILALSKQFVVPKYQRGYTWEKSEASEFLGDLQNEAESGRGLFLGTLIFHMSDEKITVVDGQQRLTTIILLLIACRNRAKELKADGIAHETQKRITFVDPTTAKSKGPLLAASESIRDAFEHICLFDWNGQFPAKIGKKPVKRQVNRIRHAFQPLQDFIKSYDQPMLSQLLGSIYKTRAIRIDIDGEEEAFSIFERTNARGVDLEVSDLLKNYLYQQGVEQLDDKWKEIIDNSDSTILKMLKYFYVSKKGYVSKSELYKKIKGYCGEIGGAAKFVEELREFSHFYSAVRKEEGPIVLKKYFESVGCSSLAGDQDKTGRLHLAMQGLRFFKVSQVYPVIYAAITSYLRSEGCSSPKMSKTLVRLFEDMEKYHFLNNAVCDRIGNEVEKLYADFCVRYDQAKDFEKTTADLVASLRKQVVSEGEFITRFCEISYSPESIPLIAYIFDRVSNYDRAPGERVAIFNAEAGVQRRNHNIEHFYPQTPDATMKVDPETLEAVDNIGNLLAISFRANSSLGNLSPAKKVLKMSGDLAKRIENLSYVKAFLQRYQKLADTWDKNAINQRARELAIEAYREVWKIN